MPASGGRFGGLLNWPLLLPLALAILTLGIVSSTTPVASAQEAGKARTHVVEIRQFKFFPATLEVKAGDVITWKNLDAAPHTATAQAWDSGRLNRNQSWSLRLTAKGTTEYICAFHPAMKGKIIVK